MGFNSEFKGLNVILASDLHSSGLFGNSKVYGPDSQVKGHAFVH